MNIVLPREIQEKVRMRARDRGISEREYVRKAVERALSSDESVESEMQAWENISLHDFRQFTKARRL